MLTSLFENAPEIISAASQNEYSMIALMMLVLSVLVVLLFKNESPRIRVSIFLIVLGAASLLLYSLLANAVSYVNSNASHKVHIYSSLPDAVVDEKEDEIRNMLDRAGFNMEVPTDRDYRGFPQNDGEAVRGTVTVGYPEHLKRVGDRVLDLVEPVASKHKIRSYNFPYSPVGVGDIVVYLHY